MVSRKPFISQESVRSLLETMLYSPADERAAALEHLILVDEFLDGHHLPQAENRRVYAVQKILADLIGKELDSHRRNFDLAPVDLAEPLSRVQEVILEDARTQSPELIGLSLLHYRYVRVDLNLSLRDYGDMTHVEERTLRRYQGRAIKRIRDALIDAESAVRFRQHRLRLYSTLPPGEVGHLIGREPLLEQTQRLLNANPPAHLQVTGPPGIGKTLFVKTLISRQIDADAVDHIVWISEPASVQYVRQYVKEMLLGDLDMSLEWFLASHRVVIVLDDMKHLSQGPASLRSLLSELSSAAVYVIHPVYLRLTPDCKSIVLSDLSYEDVHTLVRQLRAPWMLDDELQHYVDVLWQTAGGNPLAVKLALNSLNNVGLAQPLVMKDAQTVYTELYKILPPESRRLLHMFELYPPVDVDIQVLSKIWRSYTIAANQVIELLSCGLLAKASNGRYYLVDPARQWLRTTDNLPEMQFVVYELVDALERGLPETLEYSLTTIENILFRHWPVLDAERRIQWVRMTCNQGLQAGHWSTWAAILETDCDDRSEIGFELQLSRVMCLRRLSEWPEAEVLIGRIIEQAGQIGAFGWQGRALYELGIICRKQGLYEQAIIALNRANSIVRRQNAVELGVEIDVQRAQIAFESGNMDKAADIARSLPDDNITVLNMKSEIAAAVQQWSVAQVYARSALELCTRGSLEEAHIQALIGKLSFHMADMEMAAHYFVSASMILEKQEDTFALARVRSNLAAVLIHTHRDYDDARELLAQAKEIQVHIHDRSGLIYTQANLAELERRYAIDGR